MVRVAVALFAFLFICGTGRGCVSHAVEECRCCIGLGCGEGGHLVGRWALHEQRCSDMTSLKGRRPVGVGTLRGMQDQAKNNYIRWTEKVKRESAVGPQRFPFGDAGGCTIDVQ